jgi:hypothetical protein
MSLPYVPLAEKRTKLLVGIGAFLFASLIAAGVFAKNGWFPSGPDPFTGKRTGWFGRPIAQGASGWNPAAPPPTPTPLPLSREYIHAGSRLLAVEDANANAAPPADLAVWRPSTGTWWVMGAEGSYSQSWGLPTDKPVPGDYDGDGKTDFSVFRPSTGEWYYLQSSDNTWGPVMAWGTSTDIRVPADFDGDGKTDRAVWRPSDGVWYIVASSNGANTYQTYGMNGDVPAPADYDGDGRADLAVWRNSDQKFYFVNSSNGVASSLLIGQSSSEPVSADYDGDGRADHAIRNGANWIIRPSSDGNLITIPWEQSSDLAVRNDYDGDGKCDIATWRDSNGNWYIRQSASGNSLRQVQWGISGDIPVPAYYRR